MFVRIKILFSILLSAVWLSLSADNYVFRHYTVDDGLPNNGVRAICQDRWGFMWFGLDNGLCRYDGVRITTYRHNQASADQYASALFPTDSCLWIGTGHGLQAMRFSTEKFTMLTLKTARGVQITSTISAMAADGEGRLWIATQGQGLFCYDGRHGGRLRRYAFGGRDNNLATVFVDRRGGIWAVPRNGNHIAFHMKRGGKHFLKYVPPSPLRADYGVSTMIIDSRGTTWLGTSTHGLISITARGEVRMWLSTGQETVKNIHTIYELRPGTILVGSDDGLASIDTRGGYTKRYITRPGNSGSLSDRFVYPITRDREGGLWVGTFYGGINYAAHNSGQFLSYAHTADANSLSGNIINRFAEDHNGNIWISSDDGGLCSLNPATGAITRHALGGMKSTPDNVHGLLAEGGDLWVGTFMGGIYRMNLATGATRNYAAYTGRRSNSDSRSCYSLLRDSRGTLWCGTLESVSRYDARADRFVFVRRLGAIVVDIDEDRQGRLWFATQGAGLFRYDRSRNQWLRFRTGGARCSLPEQSVDCIFIDSSGRVIVAAMSGLYSYDETSGRFRPFGPRLTNTEVKAVTEERGTYWITTTNGLLCYRPGQPLRRFGKSDGLQSNQFFPNAILRARDGRIYVGTYAGFNSFNPSDIKTNKTVPTVAITGIEIMNRPVSVGSDELPLAPNHIKQLDLTHNDDVLTLLYAAQSYCTPENNRYAYRLDGFDRAWNYVGKTTRATYTNLSPGTYIFRVKAANNDGVWSRDEAVLKIVVHPHFLLSAPMKLFYFLLVVVAAVLTVRLLLRRAEERHKEETKRIREEKEREVREAKISFFTMIAHEIRTPVTLIIGPLENILKGGQPLPKPVSDDLGVIDRNARRLLYLVNQLLDFRKVEQKSLVMRFELCDMAEIVRSVGERFLPTCSQKGITLTMDCGTAALQAVVDGEAITKVVSNLMSNAVKYTRSRIELTLRPGADGQSFVIIVGDDGQGIAPGEQRRIFAPFFQAAGNKPGTGIGLSIVKSIVEQHGGHVSVESTPGRGTTFTVTVPLAHKTTETAPADNRPAGVKADEPEQTASAPHDASAQTSATASEDSETILVVEDNDDLLNFIAGNLRRTYHVLTAVNGELALGTLKEHPEVSLILSDWMMPVMDGDELCRRVRSDRMTSHLPFIMLTAKTDDGSKIEGLRSGADSYIEKPFSMEYLEERIKNLINMRRILKERFATVPLEPIKTIAPTKVDDEFLTRMQQIIEEEFSNPELSVNYIAARLAISRSGLFAKLKSLSGVTPNEMIMLVRLKRAARLLREQKRPINEVCYMVGFGNPSYFAKCFKRQFGITPAEFAAGKEVVNE